MEASLKSNTSKKIRKDCCMLDIVYGRQKVRKKRALYLDLQLSSAFKVTNSWEDINACNLIQEVAFSPSPLLTFDVCLVVSDELILTMACTTEGSVSFGCSETECSGLVGWRRVGYCRVQ